MKTPLYALLIPPDENMRKTIIAGRKTITIREGHLDYREGRPVMLCCQIEPWCVMADITSVRHTTLNDVTREEYLADGFATQADLLDGLRRFYPAINGESPVTVIRWENVRGRLVEEYLSAKGEA